MKLAFFCLALSAISGLAQDGQVTVPVVLYTKFQVEPPAAVIEAIQSELQDIMAPIGLHFEWRSLKNVRGNEVAVELAVVSFRGRCDVDGLVARGGTPGPLVWTHVSDGVILPFSDIDCDRLREFTQKEMLQNVPTNREQVFGRAIGRVLAHELYHIFANTEKHGSCGVGKSSYNVRELLSEDFQFEERNSIALKRSKAVEHLETASKYSTTNETHPPL